MLFLAEIADKMPMVVGMWGACILISVPLVLAAAIHRWGNVLALPLAITLSNFLARHAYHEAYLEGSFSVAVCRELGRAWVAHSFVSAYVPTILVFSVLVLKWWRFRRERGQLV